MALCHFHVGHITFWRSLHTAVSGHTALRKIAVITAICITFAIAVGGAQEGGDFRRERIRLTVVHRTARPGERNGAIAPAVGILRGGFFTIAGDNGKERVLLNEGEKEGVARIRVDHVDTRLRSVARKALDPEIVVSVVRNTIVMVDEIVDRQTKLLQIVRALHASRRLARSLNGG